MDWKYRIKEQWYNFLHRGELEPRYLLINCNPRSGSTWLFDSLRALPVFRFSEEATFSAKFGLYGNRYPVDLSREEQGLITEIRPGRQATISKLSISATDSQNYPKPFCVEKFHPDFYRFNSEAFAQKTTAIAKKGISFRYITLVRDPAQTIRSFVNYRERNPNWFSQVPPEETGQFLENTYASLSIWTQLLRSLVISYREFKEDPAGTLQRILQHCWPDHPYSSSELAMREIKQALQVAGNDREQKKQRSFIAKNREVDLQLPAYREPLKKMKVHYQHILQNRY